MIIMWFTSVDAWAQNDPFQDSINLKDTEFETIYFLENIQHKTPEHFMVFIGSFMISLSLCLFSWLLSTSVVDFRVKKLERKIVENHIKKDELEREIERNKK